MPVESAVRSGDDHSFGLIETLRYEPQQGCVRAERHVRRMDESARYFGRSFDRLDAERLLTGVTANEPLRIRLFLDPHGKLSMTTHAFLPVPQGAVWTVAIARTRLSSRDPLLAHKTSRREHYEAARAEFPVAGVDEVLLENESGQLCEGTITSLFVERAGRLVTPRLSHGLLRGVLRQEMLDKGAAVEGEVTQADLVGAVLYVGNSLRGLIPAKLVRST